MALSSLIASNKITVGPRYVFFQSLTSAIPPIYSKLYAQGMNYVNAAKQSLHPKDIKNQEDLEKIQKYIEYVKSLADRESINEVNFINEFSNIIKDLPDSNIKNNMLNFLKDIQGGKVNNYTKYISLINTIMINNDEFSKKRQILARDSMAFIDQVYDSLDNTIQEKVIQALHEERYSDYQKKLREAFPDDQIGIQRKFSGAISNTFASKFTSILSQISTNRQLISDLQKEWANNKVVGSFPKYITALVAKYLENFSFDDLKEKSVLEIINSFKLNYSQLTKFSNNISEEYAQNIWNLLTKKHTVERSLEEIALTTRRGLGDLFLRLEKTSQKDVVQMYAQNGFDQTVLDKINKISDTKKKSAAITEKLGKAIRERVKQDCNIIVQDTYSKQQRLEIEERLKTDPLFKNFQNKIKKRVLDPSYITNQLQVKMTGPASAEEMAANVIKNLSPSQIKILIGGGKIKAKDDLIFTYTGNINFDDIIDDKSISQSIINTISQFNENFLQNIHEKIGDKVITSVKKEAYIEELSNLRDNIKEQLSQIYSGDELTQKISQTLSRLSNLITGGIQVKDYVYGGSLGFMAESLGSNGQQILDNIEDMYATGGISSIDKDLLYFVMANCGVDGIAVDLKEDLAHYLLGGAMMILFDDGFTAAEKFLASIDLEFGFTPSTIHLFNLQGGHFVPASLVYNSIYNNLIKVYGEIASEMTQTVDTGNVSNEITIVNNITEEKDKPSWIDIPQPQTRWDTVMSMVDIKDSVDIKLTFLAGILDMFDAIPEAFNV